MTRFLERLKAAVLTAGSVISYIAYGINGRKRKSKPAGSSVLRRFGGIGFWEVDLLRLDPDPQVIEDEASEVEQAVDRLGFRLKAARQKRRWTQKDVATRLGISDVAYGDYERGRIYPTPENLHLICEIFSELDENKMYRLITKEKELADLVKAKKRVKALSTGVAMSTAPSIAAAAPSGNATAFVVNTEQEIPITIQGNPILSSEGMITIDIDMNLYKAGAKLDLIDLRSVECLKTFDLPKRFLNADVSKNPNYGPLLKQMKQEGQKTVYLSKSAFAYRVWWEEEDHGNDQATASGLFCRSAASSCTPPSPVSA